MPKQLSLLKDPRKNTKLWWIRKQHVYGGSLSYRKVERPFDSKKLTHAVFKAKLGKSLWFTRSQRSIQKLLGEVARRYDVKIEDTAINRDHIHVVFYSKRQDDHTRFLRLFAAEMGRKYKRLKQTFGLRNTGTLWIARPFTRLVSWGKRSIERIRLYLKKNRDEAIGFAPYQPRQHRLTDFLQQWRFNLDSG